MHTATDNGTIQIVEIRKEIEIGATPETTFAALLEEIGPGSELPDGSPFPMVIEPWPGGRWFRDRGRAGGHAYGHLWGHVQVIKAPVLLELTGPMMMSYPATNHVQYRLAPEGRVTRLLILHRAMGLIPPEHRVGMDEGWLHGLARVKAIAERAAQRTG